MSSHLCLGVRKGYYSALALLSSRLLSKNLKIKIYETIILLVVLYGYETWSLTLREESRLRVFENRILRRIFGSQDSSLVIMLFMKSGSLFVETSMSWVYGYDPGTKSLRHFPYNENPTRARNITSLTCCLPSTEAIDRPKMIYACIWGFKVALCKRASLKPTSFSQNKSRILS